MQNPWLVIKLGGTTVSRRKCWDNVIKRLHEALEHGQRIILVHSALAGITDLLAQTTEKSDGDPKDRILREITIPHEALAGELGIQMPDSFHRRLEELGTLLEKRNTASPAWRAGVLSMGEYLMSSLVPPFLTNQGLAVEALDARELLHASQQSDQHASRHYLSATCDHAADPSLARQLEVSAPIVLTQGFVASDTMGNTVLLGRGGSDTSAALLASKLEATALEIWTDVPGLFTTDPRTLPTARLLLHLDYDEALEIAAAGARVVHPNCIPPLRDSGIPLKIRYALDPQVPGTQITSKATDLDSCLKAVCVRHGITIITLETTDMWHQVGFLANVFACFKRHHLSVDMISTSETSMTVTLDVVDNPLATDRLAALCCELEEVGKVRCLMGAAAITLVGRRIRTNLHRIAPLLEIFADHQVHLLSQAANDLNISFVVANNDESRLVSQLHALLVSQDSEDQVFGPAWDGLSAPRHSAKHAPPWWVCDQERLLGLARENAPCYVYDYATIHERATSLRGLRNAARIYYSMKANCHTKVLQTIYRCGLGFECVSVDELSYVLDLFPDIDTGRILFTPNFAHRSEFVEAMKVGAWVTLDNLYPLHAWPSLFARRDILLRVDLGVGAGHHRHVRTSGNESKFGIPVDDLDEARRIAIEHDIRIIGLHTHAGSGIKDANHWRDTGLRLTQAAQSFPDLRIVDLGGGLGVPEHSADPALDIAALDVGLSEVAAALPGVELWLEPGRYIVSEAGVLLTRVTQLKGKAGARFAGVNTGMNSLLRPALYGAYHQIVNLSHLDEASTTTYTVVGPICETGDVFGTRRRLPETAEGDVLLIANAGAYGHVMSSQYNLRPPAREIFLEFDSSCSAKS